MDGQQTGLVSMICVGVATLTTAAVSLVLSCRLIDGNDRAKEEHEQKTRHREEAHKKAMEKVDVEIKIMEQDLRTE